MCEEYDADRDPIPGLLGNSGGAGPDVVVDAAASETPVWAPAFVSDGLVGTGGGADLALANAAGPDAILRSAVGDVEIVLRSGAPVRAEDSAAPPDAIVGEAGVELARLETPSPAKVLLSDRFAIRVMLVGEVEPRCGARDAPARLLKGFPCVLSASEISLSSLLSLSVSSSAGPDAGFGRSHHC